MKAASLQRLLSRYAPDLLVVFVGVWLSLMAESWRQARADVRAERASLGRLARDLESDIVDMEGNLERALLGMNAARLLTEAAASPTGHIEPDSLLTALGRLGYCSYFSENASEYTSLKSSGRLGIIRDADLRQDIVQLYEARGFIKWLHEKDCLVADDLVRQLSEHLTYAEPGVTPDRTRPQVIAVDGLDVLFRARGVRNSLVAYAALRQRLADYIREDIERTHAIKAHVSGSIK